MFDWGVLIGRFRHTRVIKTTITPEQIVDRVTVLYAVHPKTGRTRSERYRLSSEKAGKSDFALKRMMRDPHDASRKWFVALFVKGHMFTDSDKSRVTLNFEMPISVMLFLIGVVGGIYCLASVASLSRGEDVLSAIMTLAVVFAIYLGAWVWRWRQFKRRVEGEIPFWETFVAVDDSFFESERLPAVSEILSPYRIEAGAIYKIINALVVGNVAQAEALFAGITAVSAKEARTVIESLKRHV